jgi:hypothetical protein
MLLKAAVGFHLGCDASTISHRGSYTPAAIFSRMIVTEFVRRLLARWIASKIGTEK